jgi:tetratricopeptide (TPR) repeat protein
MLCLARSAAAQQTEADKNAARSLVQQGDARMESQDYEGALEAYRRADDIMGVPTTSIEVGRVSMLLGRMVEAQAAFARAAAYPRRDDEPEPFSRARREAAELARDLEERIPTVTIRLEGLPQAAAATITVDERPASSNVEIPLDPGEHEIAAEADGYVRSSETIELQEGARRDVTLRLSQETASLWPLAWSGYGVAGAALVVGAVTGVLSLDDAADAKQYCNDAGQCTPAAAEPLDRSRTLAHVSTASFVVAGVAAAVGTVGLIVSLSADAPNATAHLGLGRVMLELPF